MPADLHIHSNFSDGIDTPEEIVKQSAAVGLKTIALTDHDTVAGIERALAAGEQSKVEVIPGIEFTTENPRSEVHILGYFMDRHSAELAEVLTKIQQGRIDRIYEIVKKLKALGLEIEPDDVFAFSGKSSPGRPHVARALMRKGIVTNFKEAFNRFLDFRSPAYVPHYRLAPVEAVQLVKKAGGIPVFAHPVISNCDEIIPELAAAGLRGLEIYYPGYYADQIDHYLAIAAKHDLLATGGSDYHGSDAKDMKLGDHTIPDELVEKLKNEHLRGN